MKRFKVDGTLFKIKALYFVINVLVCSLHTYKAQFLVETLNLTKPQVGYAYIMQGIMFIGSMAWSSLVDRQPWLNRPLSALNPLIYAGITCLLLIKVSVWWVLIVLICSYFMSSALFPLLDAQVMHMLSKYNPEEEAAAAAETDAEGEEDEKKPIERIELQTVHADKSANIPNNVNSSKGSDRPDNSSQEALNTVVNAQGKSKNESGAKGKMLFSRQRMWGAVGVTAASWLSRYANRLTGGQSGMFGVMFISACVYSLLASLFLSSNPHSTHHHHNHHDHSHLHLYDSSRSWAQHPLIRLFKIPLWFSFMLFILSAGLTRAAINIYLSYYLDREIRLGDISPPFAASVRLLSEYGVFFCGSYFTTCFGHHGVLLISQAAGLIRILGYGHLDQRCLQWHPYLLYFLMSCLELLKGINSGLIVVGATKLAHEMAPLGCEHTAQGLLTGIFIGLGSSLAGLISGLFLEYVPNSSIGSLFRWSGWLGLAIFLVFVTHFYFSGVLKAPRHDDAGSNLVVTVSATATSSEDDEKSSQIQPIPSSPNKSEVKAN